jgi:dTDP-4-amino-4,6-dideoxygalactose transaminase
MKIPIFKLNFEDDFINSFITNAKLILETGFVGEGKWVKEFEERFKITQGCSNAIATTSGTSAIEIALKALDVRGKDVIVPTNTFFATAVAVKNAGANVVLVDCNKEDFSMCPEALESKITPNTAAVITVHIGGIISHNIYQILRICKNANIPLVEDAAHAHGSKLKGTHAGSFGAFGCFSFFPTKSMTTGEGGMVTTNDQNLCNKAQSLKNFGRAYNDIGVCAHNYGTNAKINEFTGLLGSLECARFNKRLTKRNALVSLYEQKLDKSKYEVLKQKDFKNSYCGYYKCIVKTSIPVEKIYKVTQQAKISLTGEVYKRPLHQQPVFYSTEKFPNADFIAKSHICPPLYPELQEREVDFVCKVLNEI